MIVRLLCVWTFLLFAMGMTLVSCSDEKEESSLASRGGGAKVCGGGGAGPCHGNRGLGKKIMLASKIAGEMLDHLKQDFLEIDAATGIQSTIIGNLNPLPACRQSLQSIVMTLSGLLPTAMDSSMVFFH